MSRFAGADWLKSDARLTLSPFGERVGDLLGEVFCGIYHIPERSLMRADWTNERCIEVYMPAHAADFATFDGDRLTRLVIEAHVRHVRVSIGPHGPNGVRLGFWPRQAPTEGLQRWARHPGGEELIEAVRDALARVEAGKVTPSP